MLRLMEPVITFSYLTVFPVHDRAGAYAAFSAGERGGGGGEGWVHFKLERTLCEQSLK